MSLVRMDMALLHKAMGVTGAQEIILKLSLYVSDQGLMEPLEICQVVMQEGSQAPARGSAENAARL